MLWLYQKYFIVNQAKDVYCILYSRELFYWNIQYLKLYTQKYHNMV